MDTEVPLEVELNKVIVALGINKIKKAQHLPDGAKLNGRYTKAVLERYIRHICEKKVTKFDENAFETAYTKAAESQRKQNREETTWIERYEKYEKAPPATAPAFDKDKLAAFMKFLQTRTAVITTLKVDINDTVIVYADASENARSLGAYLGGVRCVRIDSERISSGDPIEAKYTNVLLYGHTVQAYDVRGNHQVLGQKANLEAADVGRFLGDRVRVAVLGCTSIEFTAALKLAMAASTLFIETTGPFGWETEPKSNVSFVRAMDPDNGDKTIGTLSDVLR